MTDISLDTETGLIIPGVLAPPLTTSLFGYFIRPQAPVHLPGIAFFLAAALLFSAIPAC